MRFEETTGGPDNKYFELILMRECYSVSRSVRSISGWLGSALAPLTPAAQLSEKIPRSSYWSTLVESGLIDAKTDGTRRSRVTRRPRVARVNAGSGCPQGWHRDRPEKVERRSATE